MKESIRNPYILFTFLSVIFIFPFLYLPKVFNPYELPKFIVLVVAALIIGNVLLLKMVLHTKVKIHFSRIDWAVIVLLTVLLVANIFGVSFGNSLFGNAYRLQGFISYIALGYFYFISRVLNQISTKKLFEAVLVLQLFVLGLFLIIQFVLVQFTDYPVILFQNRFHGTFGNPNFAGGYIAMLFGYVLFWQNSMSILYKAKPLVLLIGGIGVILTDSRSAMVALGVVTVVYFVMLFRNFKNYRLPMFIVILIFVLGALFIASKYSFLEKRTSEWENRSIIWREGVALAKMRPILGYGQENVRIIFPKNLHFSVDNMHNIVLDQVLAAGVIGFFAMLFLFVTALGYGDNASRALILSFVITGFFNPLSLSQLFLIWIIFGRTRSGK